MSNDVRIRATVDDKVSGPLGRIRDKFDNLGKSGGFKALVQGVGLGIGQAAFNTLGNAASAAGDFIGDSIAASRDLGEQLSKSNVVFGNSAKAIEDFGNKASDSLGLSKRAALEAASTFGNFFTGLGQSQAQAAEMSKKLVTLGADLASFNNIDPSVALDKLRAGLSGEAEPLRAVGVFLSEAKVKAKAMELGLADAHGELSEGAKVLARYEIILEETKNAQGDFARTSESLANKQREANAQLEDAQAALGEKLLPAQLEVTKAQINLFSSLEMIGDSLAGKVTPETLAASHALGLLSEEELRAALAADKVADGVAFMADALKDDEFAAAAKDMANALPDAMEDAKDDAVDIAKMTPQDLADALREKRTAWQDAIEQLAEDMENPLTAAAEIAMIQAELTGDNLSAGLRSKDPVVRAQANATRQILIDRLAELNGFAWGAHMGQSYANGVLSKYAKVVYAAKMLATAQANILKTGSPAKEGPLSEGGGPDGWGEHFGDMYARGLAKSLSKVSSASRLVASGIGVPGGGGDAATGGGGGGVHLHFHGMLYPPSQAEVQRIARDIGPAILDYTSRRI